MNNKKIILLSIMFVFIGCRSDSSFKTNAFHYQLENNRYAVVIVQEGISQEEAEKEAMKKAADITLVHGYKYFMIDAKTKVQVIKTDKKSAQPTNIYYELIQNDNFGRNRPEQLAPPMGGFYTAWRVE